MKVRRVYILDERVSWGNSKVSPNQTLLAYLPLYQQVLAMASYQCLGEEGGKVYHDLPEEATRGQEKLILLH